MGLLTTVLPAGDDILANFSRGWRDLTLSLCTRQSERYHIGRLDLLLAEQIFFFSFSSFPPYLDAQSSDLAWLIPSLDPIPPRAIESGHCSRRRPWRCVAYEIVKVNCGAKWGLSQRAKKNGPVKI